LVKDAALGLVKVSKLKKLSLKETFYFLVDNYIVEDILVKGKRKKK